ncbi:precorrin-2 C(20)-methyltransferase [Paraconexibacter algicola]|uniref:ATP-binding protein n=1 Tax=Paraconexibacter algicola TaxID=2133960 RepID=A0A2T4UJP2_9ACTN|nr:precorrin-2 C(20)-methyltransferase [Paraconexibacter algicola]PTL59417.1 ATP-binding protein [Paraconexibacter algicola]
MSGRLTGLGVGPGDPELLTVKALRILQAADVVAYPIARGRRGVARSAAAPHLRDHQLELPLVYPTTVEGTDDAQAYDRALRDYYDAGAEAIAAHLDAGRDVVVLCEGDPFFYGSYMYLHERLAHRYPTEVVPGVTAFSAAAAAAGAPLCKHDDVLTVLPGTLPRAELARRLADGDAAVVMKLGRTFAGARAAAQDAGVADRGVYVERASHPDQRVAALEDVDAGGVPYMSIVLVPTSADDRLRRERDRPRAVADTPPATAASDGAGGWVSVVGLGPAGPAWRTPEASATLDAADALIGYDTYVRRVPDRPGLERFPTDNRVELDRARHALELAAAGRRVAVVSSGDPGIFAMAAAVLEAWEEERAAGSPLGDVDVRVVPGISAMQAAAARVGAPLGHDFAVVSLSDILKPWEVVERRLDAAGAADFALALYNPASRTRREQLDRAVEVLRRHRAPDTPVVVARAVGAPEETVDVVGLGELDTAVVDMRTLLLVGSSQSRVTTGTDGRSIVHTPRSYPVRA